MIPPETKHNTETSFELLPAGTYNAVCYRVVSLGSHWIKPPYHVNEKGQLKDPQVPIALSFEVEERMTNGFRFGVFETFRNFTLEPHLPIGSNKLKSRFRQFLKAWLGEDPGGRYDTKHLLGKPCLLSIVHNKSQDGSSTYANISSIMPLPKGMTPLVPENPVFEFDPANFDAELFDKLTRKQKERISQSIEFIKQFGGEIPQPYPVTAKAPQPTISPKDNYDDDIPPF